MIFAHHRCAVRNAEKSRPSGLLHNPATMNPALGQGVLGGARFLMPPRGGGGVSLTDSSSLSLLARDPLAA
jgi:hypothetical protein